VNVNSLDAVGRLAASALERLAAEGVACQKCSDVVLPEFLLAGNVCHPCAEELSWPASAAAAILQELTPRQRKVAKSLLPLRRESQARDLLEAVDEHGVVGLYGKSAMSLAAEAAILYFTQTSLERRRLRTVPLHARWFKSRSVAKTVEDHRAAIHSKQESPWVSLASHAGFLVLWDVTVPGASNSGSTFFADSVTSALRDRGEFLRPTLILYQSKPSRLLCGEELIEAEP
jgi:hypothetical protein